MNYQFHSHRNQNPSLNESDNGRKINRNVPPTEQSVPGWLFWLPWIFYAKIRWQHGPPGVQEPRSEDHDSFARALFQLQLNIVELLRYDHNHSIDLLPWYRTGSALLTKQAHHVTCKLVTRLGTIMCMKGLGSRYFTFFTNHIQVFEEMTKLEIQNLLKIGFDA